MALFKKEKAILIDKMNRLERITVSSDKIHFRLNYSDIDVKAKDIPLLVSDMIQIYGMVKPILDAQSEELNKENEGKEKEDQVEPIDLSDIPF